MGKTAGDDLGGSPLSRADDYVAESSVSRMQVNVPARVPLVGRLAELRALHEAYRLVQEGSADVFGIRGEAGIGKTRLIRAFVDDLRTSTRPVFTTRCSETLDAPLLPISRLLQRAARDESVPVETRQRCVGAIDQLADETGFEVSSRRAQLFMSLSELLVSVASGRPTAIIIDDVQWAGPVTRDFIEFFASELLDDPAQTRTLLVLTERSSFEGSGSTAGCCERLASWIELGPLDSGALRLLLRGLGIDRPSRRFIADLWRGTKGNTLHLIETVRQLAAAEAFVERDGMVDTSQLVRTSVPADLSATVSRQIDNLPEETGDVLKGLAVLGDESSLSLLGRLFGLATEVVQNRLSPAVDAGIVERQEAVVSFSHPLFRQVLENGVSDALKTKLHSSAVRAFLDGGVTGKASIALTVAPHIVAAGSALTLGPELRTRLLSTAARQSFAVAGWEEAHRFYLAALSSESISPDERGWLHYEAGRSAELSFDWVLADHHFRAAAELAHVVDDPELGAWAAISHLHARTVAGQRPRFRDELDTRVIEGFVERLGPEHGTAQVAVRTQFSQSLSSIGETRKARQYAEEALVLATDMEDSQSLVKAEMTAGLAASFQLDVSAAVEHYRHGQAIAERIGDDLRSGHGLTRLALLELMVGHLDEARRTADQARPVNLRNKQWSDLALIAGVQAQVCLLRGDFVGVESWGREGEYYIELSDYPFAPGVVYPILATARAIQGEHAAASRAIDTWASRSGRSHRATRAALRRWSGGGHEPTTKTEWNDQPSLPNLARLLLAAEDAETPESAADIDRLLSRIPDKTVFFAPGSTTNILRARAHLADVTPTGESALSLARAAADRCDTIGASLEQSLTLLVAARLGATTFTQRALADLTRSWRIAERLGASPVSAEAEALAHQIDPTYELREGETSRSYRVVMFVDMVGSVAISVRSDQLYLDLIDHQFTIVRSRIAEFGGTEFGTSGDAVLAWFDSTSRAVRSAMGIQADVGIAPQPRPDATLAVKVGIAAGKLLERSGYLYGRVVNLAARLSDEATAGQTVLTKDLESEVPRDLLVKDIGLRELKGFDTALHLVSIDTP